MDSVKHTYVQERDPKTGEVHKYLVQADGSKVLVRDERVAEREMDPNSHRAFFANRTKVDDKQAIRRQQALSKQFEQLAMDRVDVNYHPNVKFVTESTWFQLRQDPAFESVSLYAHKLVLKSGKRVRSLLRGELGMIGATIYCLEAGEGRLVQGGLGE